jgi:hypothetical protein
MSAKMGSFQKDGKEFPTIELKNGNGSKFGFTFGLSKARLILDHVDEIQKFVEGSEKTEN